MSEEAWVTKLRAGKYAATDAMLPLQPMDWAVDGYLPAVGTTVWFGTGATGKTQLLLTLAAAIARPASKRPNLWLGSPVRSTGHVLVLSAEDLRSELLRRLNGIVDALDLPAEQKSAICSRIHIVPFLSLSEAEFAAKNPCLFEQVDREWVPTRTLNDIESYIETWNRSKTAGDRITTVVMDSATTMAGFETTNSEATTNFLFYLNRLCVRLGLSWSIIGHTPKEVKIDPRNPQDNAIARLRGSAMWSTTPRSVVEVRLAHPDENLGNIEGVDLNDLIIVTVAKANSFQAQREPRFLKRVPGGGYDDITSLGPKRSANSNDAYAYTARDKGRLDEVVRMVRELVAKHEKERLSVRLLTSEFSRRQSEVAAFAAMDGAANSNPDKAPHGSLSWCLHEIHRHGGIQYRANGFDVLDLDKAHRAIEAAAAA